MHFKLNIYHSLRDYFLSIFLISFGMFSCNYFLYFRCGDPQKRSKFIQLMIEIRIPTGKYFILALPLNHSPVTPHTKYVFFWFIFAFFFRFLFFLLSFSVTRSAGPKERKRLQCLRMLRLANCNWFCENDFLCFSIHTDTNLSPEVNTIKRFCRNRFRTAALEVTFLWWVSKVLWIFKGARR